MSDADERRYAYEAQQRAPKPEPTFEYQVVCADGEQAWPHTDADPVDAAKNREWMDAWCERMDGQHHEHTIERRTVGPWEKT